MTRTADECDVVIVVGGPAGLAAAIAARRRGLSVTLADASRMPVDKACGEGLMPDGVSALRELGITIRADESFAFRGVRLIDGSLSAYGHFAHFNGLGVRRTVLHRMLAECALEIGVAIYWGAPVMSLNAAGVRIGDRIVRARWIVGADGQNSRVRRSAGLDTAPNPKVRVGTRTHFRLAPWTDAVEVHWHEHGQASVTPVAAQEVCVALLANSKVPISIADLPSLFPTLAARLAGAQPTDSVRGAVTLTSRLRSVVNGRIVLIGDASGSVDAITGEGLSMALRQALILGDALADGNLAEYQAAHRRIMRMPLLMARLIMTMDGRATLRRTVLRALAARPHLFSRLLAAQVGALAPSAVVLDAAGLAAWILLLGAAAGLAQL